MDNARFGMFGALGHAIFGHRRRFTKWRLQDICRKHGCTRFSLLGGMATAVYSEPPRPDDADNPALPASTPRSDAPDEASSGGGRRASGEGGSRSAGPDPPPDGKLRGVATAGIRAGRLAEDLATDDHRLGRGCGSRRRISDSWGRPDRGKSGGAACSS